MCFLERNIPAVFSLHCNKIAVEKHKENEDSSQDRGPDYILNMTHCPHWEKVKLMVQKGIPTFQYCLPDVFCKYLPWENGWWQITFQVSTTAAVFNLFWFILCLHLLSVFVSCPLRIHLNLLQFPKNWSGISCYGLSLSLSLSLIYTY